MEPRLSLLTLGVSDLARARAFYAALGWTESAASNEHVAFLRTRGAVVALWSRAALAQDAGLPDAGPGFRGVALAHNVRERAQVAAVLEQARRAGARVIKEAQDTFWGGHSGYFTDPDGHVWEVAWNPGFPLDAQGEIQLP
jgi:uncharacterized glyoxalase superfamily protein PhnB